MGVLSARVLPFYSGCTLKQVPAALATSAPEARVKPALAKAGLDEKFAAIITAEDVHRGRPDPEGYLFAAQQIGRPPSRTVIIGNSNQVCPVARLSCKVGPSL